MTAEHGFGLAKSGVCVASHSSSVSAGTSRPSATISAGGREAMMSDLASPALASDALGPEHFGLADDLDAVAVDQVEVTDDVGPAGTS